MNQNQPINNSNSNESNSSKVKTERELNAEKIAAFKKAQQQGL
jgi:hypothetical protein